jgi:hypothetical protein
MLADGYWDRNVAVADLGEDYMEHLTDRRPWRPPMKENALREVDVLVGEQERERVNKQQRKKQFQRRAWDEARDGKAAAKDLEHLQRIAKAVGGRAISDVSIQCNLLVIEPDQKDGKPHVFAFRFINPKTVASHAQRKQERVNLLRLYAYLGSREAAPTASDDSRQRCRVATPAWKQLRPVRLLPRLLLPAHLLEFRPTLAVYRRSVRRGISSHQQRRHDLSGATARRTEIPAPRLQTSPWLGERTKAEGQISLLTSNTERTNAH